MIRKATKEDASQIAQLASNMWANKEELIKEFEQLLNSNKNAVFLYEIDNKCVAFAQCSLRYDYVEGTHTSPVGYLEGIFVEPQHRKQGIAKQLLNSCKQWAKNKGCSQFASDCELSNTDSYNFHIAVGFCETNKIICFKKEI